MKKGKPAKEEMMEFMKNKYNEEFEFVNIGTENWNAKYTEMIVHSEKFPKGRIVVRKGKNEIVDNYTDFLMKEQIEEEMSPIVAQVYPESKVFYRPGGLPMSGDVVNPDMSVEEYLKARIVTPSLTICIRDVNCKLNKEEKIEELRKTFESKGYRFDFNIFYLLDGKLDLINDDNCNELFNGSTEAKWSMIRGYFIMDEEYKFKSIRWSEINE